MKKLIKKSKLVIIVLVMLIVSNIYLSNQTIEQKVITDESKIQAFYIDECELEYMIFENIISGKKIAPYTLKNPDESITRAQLVEHFQDATPSLTVMTVTSATGTIITSPTAAIGTGTTVIVNGDVNPYTILIYGDIDGDGKAGMADVMKLVNYYLYDGAGVYGLTELEFLAANIGNTTGDISLSDVMRIINFYLETLDEKTNSKELVNPIANLTLTDKNKSATSYSKERFIIGTIETGKNEEKITTTNVEVAITNLSGITTGQIIIEYGLVGTDVVVYCETAVPGTFTITLNVKNNNTVKTNSKQITTTKNQTIGSFTVVDVVDYELDAGKTIYKQIIFKNINNEDIDVKANKVTITPSAGFVVQKISNVVGQTGTVIADEINTDIKYIGISSAAVQNGTVTVAVNGVTGTKSLNIVMPTQVAKLTTITFTSSTLNLTINDATVMDSGIVTNLKYKDPVSGKVYVLVPVEFKDQYTRTMNIQNGDFNEFTEASNKISIIPEVNATMDGLDILMKTFTMESSNIVPCVQGGDAIKYIGFATGPLRTNTGTKILNFIFGTDITTLGNLTLNIVN